jgi:hypothetical protein
VASTETVVSTSVIEKQTTVISSYPKPAVTITKYEGASTVYVTQNASIVVKPSTLINTVTEKEVKTVPGEA